MFALPAITAHRIRQWCYIPLLGAAMVLMFGRLLMMARLLSLEQFAGLNIALIISGIVAMFSCMGLFVDLQRKLPVCLDESRLRTAALQMALTILGGSVVAGIGFAIVVILWGIGHISLEIGIAGIFHGFSQQLFLVATTESRSRGEPLRYSNQNLLRAVLVVGLTVPVAALSHSAVAVLLTEAAIALIASALILSGVFRAFAVPFIIALTISAKRIRLINWTSMLSLILVSIVVAASMSSDRWLAAHFLAREDFALYAFGSILMTAAISTQALVNASVFPAIAKRRASSGPRAAFRLTFKISIFLLITCVLLIIPGVYTLDYLVPRYYPKYTDATALFLPLAIAATLRLSDFWSGYLLIAERENTVLVINIGALLVGGLVWALTVGEAPTPLQIAYIAVFIAACTCLLTFFASFHEKNKTTAQ